MRVLAIALLLISSFPLQASFFLSNAIGQDLGAIEALTGEGYEGEVSDGAVTIYQDGIPIIVTTETDERITRRENGYEESIVLGSDMRRIRESINDQGRLTERIYSYDGDRLSSVTITGDDGIERIIEYIDTPTGRLMGLSGSVQGYMGSSYYIYSMDGSSITASLHGVPDSTGFVPDPAIYSVDENGFWRGVRDGIARVYSPDGHLISLDAEGRSEHYSYNDEGVMISSSVLENDRRTETEYSEGARISERIYIDGIISIERAYNEDGTIAETRYRDGVPRSLIIFDSDGLRIRRVENLR